MKPNPEAQYDFGPLTTSILKDASIVESFMLSRQGCSATATSTQLLPPDAPEEVHAARLRLKRDALNLFRLACGPAEYVSHVALNHQYSTGLRYLVEFNVFQHVPLEGSISTESLSVVTSAPVGPLTVVLRTAMTSGLFASTSDSRISHSPASRLLALDCNYRSWATCISHHTFDASHRIAEASRKWRRSAEKSHSAFNIAFMTDLPFPEYLQQNPQMAREMRHFVAATGTLDANSPRHLVAGFEWASLGEATIIEVGASSATCSIALAEKFSSLVFKIEAAPYSVEKVKQSIAQLADSGLRKRFEWSTRSILAPRERMDESLPTTHRPTVYLLRHVLHNLPDPVVISVLKNLYAAHETSGPPRVLIMDLASPEIGELDPYQEGMLWTRSMIQLEMSNSATRGIKQWSGLAAAAGAAVVSVRRPFGSDLSLFELQWQ